MSQAARPVHIRIRLELPANDLLLTFPMLVIVLSRDATFPMPVIVFSRDASFPVPVIVLSQDATFPMPVIVFSPDRSFPLPVTELSWDASFYGQECHCVKRRVVTVWKDFQHWNVTGYFPTLGLSRDISHSRAVTGYFCMWGCQGGKG